MLSPPGRWAVFDVSVSVAPNLPCNKVLVRFVIHHIAAVHVACLVAAVAYHPGRNDYKRIS